MCDFGRRDSAARSFAYRVVFADTASHQRMAVDSVLLAHDRIEAEIDQIVQGPSAVDLAHMKAGDRYLAGALDQNLLAAG